MKPDISKIDEAIVKAGKWLKAHPYNPEDEWKRTILFILQHTKLHGLALTEEELKKIIGNADYEYCNAANEDQINIDKLAQSIANRQKGNHGER